MAVGSNGAHNKPVFNNVSATQSDLQAAADFAYAVGNAKSGTTAERTALTGSDVWEGLLFADTTTDLLYQRVGSAWIVVQGHLFDNANGLFPVATGPSSSSAILTQAGTASVSLNSNGDGTLTFPTAFPNGLLTVQLQRYDYSSYGGYSIVLNASTSKSVSTFRVYQASGAVLPSVTIFVTWLALGW